MAIPAWFNQLPCVWDVVHGEPIPQPTAWLCSQVRRTPLLVCETQTVDRQMDGIAPG
jgi:hypothetical protein